MLLASPGPQRAPRPPPLSSFYSDQGLEADSGAEPAVLFGNQREWGRVTLTEGKFWQEISF